MQQRLQARPKLGQAEHAVPIGVGGVEPAQEPGDASVEDLPAIDHAKDLFRVVGGVERNTRVAPTAAARLVLRHLIPRGPSAAFLAIGCGRRCGGALAAGFAYAPYAPPSLPTTLGGIPIFLPPPRSPCPCPARLPPTPTTPTPPIPPPRFSGAGTNPAR